MKNPEIFFSKAFYKNLKLRIDFLEVLAANKINKDSDLSQEAYILCLCYIDGLASETKATNKKSSKRFIEYLIKYGGNPQFGAIHPLIFWEYLYKSTDKKLNNLEKSFKPFLKKLPRDGKCFTEEEFIFLIEKSADPVFTEKQKALIKKCLYHGTIAAKAYEIRCDAVHEIVAGEIHFSRTSFNNVPIKELSFESMLNALKNMINIILARF